MTTSDFIDCSFTLKLKHKKLEAMKTIKYTFLIILLISSLIVISKPASNGLTVEKAEYKLFNDIRNNLVRWHALEDIAAENTIEFIVHCNMTENNEVNVLSIEGENIELRNRVINIMEQHPVKASKKLKNLNLVFKLKFDRI